MNEFTFGDTPAAKTLVKMVENNPSHRKKVAVTLTQFLEGLWQLTLIKDKRLAGFCMIKWRDHAIQRFDLKSNMTPEIKSYATNVITMYWRKAWRAYQLNSKPK